MRFRPCIDIHNGQVKQIVGGSLRDAGDYARENYVAEQNAVWFADFYKSHHLSGGHVILLNAADSPYYQATKKEALSVLSACPGMWQAGGGIREDNAPEFLRAGASHVIVTSWVFENGRICMDRLRRLSEVTGPDRLVLDLSCRKKGDDYYIVTDRWQTFTDVKLCHETLDMLASYCSEFLVHAADVEGKCRGIEPDVVSVLGSWEGIPVTYAGGIGSLKDLEQIRLLGNGKVDVTVGSALEIFGGNLPLQEVLKQCEKC